MASVSLFSFLLFSHLVLLLSAEYGNGNHGECPRSFDCGQLGSIHFPFTKPELQHCGFITINGCDDPSSSKTIQLEKNGTLLLLKNVFQQDSIIITVFDAELNKHLKSRTCELFNNYIALSPKSPFASFHIKHNVTLFRCKHQLGINPPDGFVNHVCPDYDIYGDDLHRPLPTLGQAQSCFSACAMLHLPCKNLTYTKDPSSFYCGEIEIEVQLSDDCDKCYNHMGGECQVDTNNNFYCDIENGSKLLKLELGLGLGGLLIGLTAFLIMIRWLLRQHHKRKHASSNVQLQSTSNNVIDHSSNTDLKSGMAYFGVSVFSYEELQKATSNFDRSRELGNGGFSSVYYGTLQDGQAVAVKRLNDRNYRRIEQFRNEVQILTHLRHRNLVSLYGFTSHHCRELLLVYEYIPKGTVSCHLHGELANPALLPWPIRIKIATETATALTYLHACDVIHRDVKTDNILLDNNFCAKVAGFGLSRLLPSDVVSTAPQGTPGYIDPEYQQFHQLTYKSDVYSFGVVLIELISSMPAVDMSRHKDEIILANLAMKKIQKNAFKELVDPSLGFELNDEVRRMIVSVAELAFQCLQIDKELRPSMEEVLEILKRIETGKEEPYNLEEVDTHGVTGISHIGMVNPPSPPSQDCEEDILLKNIKSTTSN